MSATSPQPDDDEPRRLSDLVRRIAERLGVHPVNAGRTSFLPYTSYELTGVGVQGFANEAGKRSVDRTKLHGRRDVGFLTPWFKDPKAK